MTNTTIRAHDSTSQYAESAEFLEALFENALNQLKIGLLDRAHGCLSIPKLMPGATVTIIGEIWISSE